MAVIIRSIILVSIRKFWPNLLLGIWDMGSQGIGGVCGLKSEPIFRLMPG